MANITEIIGGQPYFDAATGNMKNKLLNFWKGTNAEYTGTTLKRSGGTLSGAPSGATSLAFTGLTSVASGWDIGDTVYITANSGTPGRTTGTVSAVPSATSLTVTVSAYTSTDTANYIVDKYAPNTLYLIT